MSHKILFTYRLAADLTKLPRLFMMLLSSFFLLLLSFSFFPFLCFLHPKTHFNPTLVHFTWISSHLCQLFLHLHWRCQYHLVYQSVILAVACTFSPLQLNWKLPEDRERKKKTLNLHKFLLIGWLTGILKCNETAVDI